MRRPGNVDWSRVMCCLHRMLILLYVVVALLLLKWFGDFMFYPDASTSTWHFYRFIWCFAIALLAGAMGLWVRFSEYGSIVLYVFYYPSVLAAIASLVFVTAQASTSMSGYLFYYFTGSLCFILGATVDYFLNTISRALSALLNLANKA
jgi:hypothetical protein